MTKLKVVCAWCGADMGEKDGEGQEGISHGMCDKCYNNLQGTDEQAQVDYMENEDFEKVKDEFKNADYLCFECSDIWKKK